MDENINWNKVLKGKIYGFGELKIESKEGRTQRVYCRVERELKIEDVFSYRIVGGEVRFVSKDGKRYVEALDILNDTEPIEPIVERKRKRKLRT